jgi:hypothetical protein
MMRSGYLQSLRSLLTATMLSGRDTRCDTSASPSRSEVRQTIGAVRDKSGTKPPSILQSLVAAPPLAPPTTGKKPGAVRVRVFVREGNTGQGDPAHPRAARRSGKEQGSTGDGILVVIGYGL